MAQNPRGSRPPVLFFPLLFSYPVLIQHAETMSQSEVELTPVTIGVTAVFSGCQGGEEKRQLSERLEMAIRTNGFIHSFILITSAN